MPDAPPQAVEIVTEGMDKRHHSVNLEKSRGVFRTQGNGLLWHQPVPNHFSPKCWMQDIIFCPGKKEDYLEGEEQICRHISAEGQHSRFLRVLGTYGRPQPADLGGQGEQRKSTDCLA